MTWFLKVAFILGSVGVKYGSADDGVTFHVDKRYNGESHSTRFEPSLELCENLPEEFHDVTSSISYQDAHSSCMTVFALENCQGAERRLETPREPGSVGHANLDEIHFDNEIRSFKPCPPELYPTTTTETHPRLKPTFPLSDDRRVIFYDQPGHTGKYFTIYFNKDKCYTLPANLWYDRTSSVDTYGSCVHFYELENCVGNSTRVAPGTPSHDDLGNIGLDKTIRSFEPCIFP